MSLKNKVAVLVYWCTYCHLATNRCNECFNLSLHAHYISQSILKSCFYTIILLYLCIHNNTTVNMFREFLFISKIEYSRYQVTQEPLIL